MNGRRFSVGKQILFSVIIVVVTVVAAEAGIRTWALFFRTSYERYNPGTGRLELVPNLRHTTPRGEEFRINSRGFVGPEFEEQPSKGVYRIIAVGDSCTFSDGLWRLSYPGLLERYLNAAAGHTRFEVINAGIEGYNSTFARQRIEQELLGYRPHLVVLYIGWNDLMKVDPRKAQGVGQYATLAGLMDQSYLVRAYRKILFAHLRPLLFKPKVSVDEAELRAYEAFVPHAYRQNVLEIVRMLRGRDIHVLLVTLPTVVRPGMTREDLEREDVFFPHFAATYSVGEFLSLHGAYNRVIRGIATASDVQMLDLDHVLNRHEKDPLFWDTMHPSRKGHCLIAQELYAHIAPKFGLNWRPAEDHEGICK